MTPITLPTDEDRQQRQITREQVNEYVDKAEQALHEALASTDIRTLMLTLLAAESWTTFAKETAVLLSQANRSGEGEDFTSADREALSAVVSKKTEP